MFFSRASFRRAAVSGRKLFSVLSLYISNIYVKKNGIAKNLILTLRAILISQEVDVVAGDFNRTAWRCRSSDNITVLLMKLLLIVPCLRRRAPHHCGDPDPSRITGRTSEVFLSTPGSQRFWRVGKHGAFSITRKALGRRPNDQSCHHEAWLHLHFVDWSNKWSHQAYCNRNIRLKELENGTSAKY